MGERGCRHFFTWGASWPPPEMSQANCCACGTSARWQNGVWDVFQESPVSQSLAAWREVAHELAEALRPLLDVVDEGLIAPTRSASLALARFDALDTEEHDA